VNCNYFIPNVIGQRAYWFISRIRICFTAGSAPVAVKCSAMNQATKLRTCLYNKNMLQSNQNQGLQNMTGKIM
jgi:hypothetical protein